MEDTSLVFYVNGGKVVESNPDPEVTLLHYLRRKLRLTGSKLGCGEGGCGACTVMVSRYNSLTDTISHFSVNACLAPVCSLHGLSVTTVEGIGSTKTRLHPVQEVLARSHGSQCGFCTPGIVMSMYTLLRNFPHPSQQQVEDNFDGNLCRCTGYRPILQGFSSFTKTVCVMGEACCKVKGNQERVENDVVSGNCCRENGITGVSYDPSQEPIFPPELKTKFDVYERPLKFSTERVTWYRPVSLDALLDLKTRHPTARIVIGNTEVGIETKFKNMQYPVIISATNASELTQHETTDTGLVFGSSVTLSTLNSVLQHAVETLPEHKTRVYKAMVEMLKWFAGHQIRNVASIGGNIMTASPISDLNPLLMAAGATLTVQAKGKPRRTIPMDGGFFRGYRKTAVQSEEVLLSIHIPYTSQNEYFTGFKQANRKDDDISIVNAGMRVMFRDGTDIVHDVTMAYGGMAPTTVLAKNTMAGLKGEKWNDDLLTKACRLLESDLPLAPGSPGGQVEYRRTLTTSFFFKVYVEVNQKLNKEISSTNEDAVGDVIRATSEGVQVFQEVPAGQCPDDAVGRPLVHTSALQQTTGEALYIDDLPVIEGELYAAPVMSTKAHASIASVDASDALRMSGVVDFVTHKDIPGVTTFGVVTNNEQEIFASDEVVYNGQVIGCILGKTQTEAQRAAKAVRIKYEERKPILTIKEAIEAKSFLVPEMCIESGDLDPGLAGSDLVIEGEIHLGSQEHFYFETHAVAARPTNEEGGMEIISNTQFPSGIQHQVAETLDVPANRIVSRCKRIGGGFGGKESHSALIVLPVAVCAAKMNRPVRCMLDRDEDISISGTRHAFLARYKVGVMKTGHIKAMDVALYSNGGCSLDLSRAVMNRAMHSIDNVYNIPNLRVRGTVCKTNLPSATAFRGFGSPQAMFVTETIIDEVSKVIDKSQCEIRHINMYHEGDFTFYGQEVIEANIRKLWDQCFDQSDFVKRQNQVEDFNRRHRWKKRGISIIPTKYPLSYPRLTNFLNQACALVTVYKDGSVLVAQCGTEMGQGLYTKIIQIASRALGVPASSIYINDTCTDKVPLTAPTAASVGSDTNGAAVQVACEKLRKRLEPFREGNPKGSFKDWVQAAYFDRVHLSATGYYRTEGMDYDPETKRGRMFNYFTCGVACSEVEIDCLTGDHQVLRTDIVMDVGKSLNPAIDIGQIEGGFIQGYGLFCLEQHKISPSGFIMTRGPGTYKIPGFKNIPVKLNVTLLKDSANSRAVYSSKGIGEPPLFLASSTFFAIKDAIRSARRDAGHGTDFRLDSPATPEKIRMACLDQFTKQFPAAPEGTYTPWYVKL